MDGGLKPYLCRMNRKLRLTELNRLSVAAYKEADKTPLVVVLDNIRSMHNVGAVFRTADAFCLEAVYLCGITPKPPHREIRKTAIGAEESVHWKTFETTLDAVNVLREDGYTVLAVEQAVQATALHAYFPEKGNKLALVMGNEVEGVAQAVVDVADVCIEIPQYGTKHSLNVSVCTGVVLWDLFRKLVLE